MEYESSMGWFSTLEFPPRTAKLVQVDKAVKYATKLKPLPNGNCVVLYRGYTDQEKAAIKIAKKMERDEARNANKRDSKTSG